MKLLSENMLRFGTKNLSEGSKRNLTLESIMQTIAENGLKSAVMNRLLESLGNLDATIKTTMETEITNFNTAFKKQYPNTKYYLKVEESSQPGRGTMAGDESYALYITLFMSNVKGQIGIGRVDFQQDINGTIFQKSLSVNSRGDDSANTKIGFQYANDPAKTQAPDQNAISTSLSNATLGKSFAGLDADIKSALASNLQQYIVRALMDAFKAIQVYPVSSNNRENFNLQKGKQTQTGGATKGVSPYKKG
jgi:hypothetical protein